MGSLTSEQQKLVSDNHKLIYSILYKQSLDIEEYYGIAAIGLCKAAIGYDTTKGIKFSTFAYRCILNEIRMEFRKTNKYVSTVSIDEDYYNTSGEAISSLLESLIGDSDMERNVIENTVIFDRLKYLRLNELIVLLGRLEGKTQVDIANTMGVTRSYTSHLSKNIAEKLTSEMEPKSYKVKYSPEQLNQYNTLTEEIKKQLSLAGGIGIEGALAEGKRGRPRKDKQEAPKQEAPKQEAPKQEAPKQEAPKQEAPKQEAPKQIQKQTEAPKQEQKIGVYAGSFDPITIGHMDIITRAAKLFDKLIVVIGINEEKNYTFSISERKEMITYACKNIKNVEVTSFNGLISTYAKVTNAVCIVRGLREVSDFESEFRMAITNKKLNSDLETIFIPCNLENMFISSTVVKQVIKLGGSIENFIPPGAAEVVNRHNNNKKN